MATKATMPITQRNQRLENSSCISGVPPESEATVSLQLPGELGQEGHGSIVHDYDNKSYIYDIQDNCTIADGQTDVFDNGFWLVINSSTFSNIRYGVEDNGREALCANTTIALMNVSRKVFVPAYGEFARYLEILHNPTAGEVCVDVKIESNMGSDGSDFMNTSDYDATWELSDNWMIWEKTKIRTTVLNTVSQN